MKQNIYLFFIGLGLALLGAYLNPMMWFDNFKGERTPMIYLYALMLVGGLILVGVSLAWVGKSLQCDDCDYKLIDEEQKI